MNPPSRKFPLTVGIGLLLLLLTFALTALLARINARLGNRSTLPIYGQVGDFSLTNQAGAAVSFANLRGRPWVADIIFTRCPGPCPRMTRQMRELQDALPPTNSVKLVTLTTDPDHDTPSRLKAYSEQDWVRADTNRWMFLTGPKKEIARLATGSLKLAAIEKKPEERESPEDLWVHSTIFVVVDKRGQVRGIYETGGEGVDWVKSKQDILSALRQLERER